MEIFLLESWICFSNVLSYVEMFKRVHFIIFQISVSMYIVGTPPPFLQGRGGGVSLQPNFQKGGAWQDLNF